MPAKGGTRTVMAERALDTDELKQYVD